MQRRALALHTDHNVMPPRPISKTCNGCRCTFEGLPKARYCSRGCARKYQSEECTYDPAALLKTPDEYTRALISIVTERRPARVPMSQVRIDAIDLLIAHCLEELASTGSEFGQPVHVLDTDPDETEIEVETVRPVVTGERKRPRLFPYRRTA